MSTRPEDSSAAAAAHPLAEFYEGEFYEVTLSHYYETHLFRGDYSNGTFKEGSMLVRTLAEAKRIHARFRLAGEITIYLCRDRYLGKHLGSERKTCRFMSDAEANEQGVRYTPVRNIKIPMLDQFVSLRKPKTYVYYYSAAIHKRTSAAGILDPLPKPFSVTVLGALSIERNDAELKVRGFGMLCSTASSDPRTKIQMPVAAAIRKLLASQPGP
jgi:hypothetical protein